MKTYPLLQSQLGVFLQCMQHPEIMQYNLPSVVKLDGNVDLDRLAEAVESLYAQRRELHISFMIDDNGEPRQYVNEQMTFRVLRKRMSEKEFNEYAFGGGFVRPFDILGGECLFRCEIIEGTEKPLAGL